MCAASTLSPETLRHEKCMSARSIPNTWFKVQGSGYRVQGEGSGCRFKFDVLGFMVHGSGFTVERMGYRIKNTWASV